MVCARGAVARRQHGFPDRQPSRPRVPALRGARRRVAAETASLRPALARDDACGGRYRAGNRGGEVRSAQSEGGRARADLPRRARPPHSRGEGSARGVHRRWISRRRRRFRQGRHAASDDRARSLPGDLRRRQREHHRIRLADPRQRRAARGLRVSGAERALPQAPALGPLLRDHGAHRATGGVVAVRHPHDRHAQSGRQLLAAGDEDLHLRRGPRPGREHRPPRAGEDSRGSPGREGHLPVRRPQVPRERRRQPRSGQRRDARGPSARKGNAAPSWWGSPTRA